MEHVRSYLEYSPKRSFRENVRSKFRGIALYGLSLQKSLSKSKGWIRFPYYHHVFDDEKNGFRRQLKYLKNYGDFITIDEVCELMLQRQHVKENYFCLSFDDGFQCCFDNMMEVTVELEIPVVIYLAADYIGIDQNSFDGQKKLRQINPHLSKPVYYLTWEECRQMLNHNISFGSHTFTHANLISLSRPEIREELVESKKKIEQELQRPCLHFACPWGKWDINFTADTVEIAKECGYKSFATTHRGKMLTGFNIYDIPRDHLLSDWSNYQLKYFFGE